MAAGNDLALTLKAKDQMSPVIKAAQGTLDRFKRDAMTGFGLHMGANFAMMAADAFRVFAGAAADALRAARDLTEQQTKTNYVFQDASMQVRSFASAASESFGMSERAALSALGTMGNLLTAIGKTPAEAAQMSLALTKLAADVSSFNNVASEEVLRAFQAALVGEAEPARRLGVNISMARVEVEALAKGMAKSKSEITDADKIMARYNIILEDTKNAHGDFARTSENLANQQRIFDAQMENLSATMGKFVEGPAVGFIGFLNDFLSRFQGPQGVNAQLALMIEQMGQVPDLPDTGRNRYKEYMTGYQDLLDLVATPMSERGQDFVSQWWEGILPPGLVQTWKDAGGSLYDLQRAYIAIKEKAGYKATDLQPQFLAPGEVEAFRAIRAELITTMGAAMGARYTFEGVGDSVEYARLAMEKLEKTAAVVTGAGGGIGQNMTEQEAYLARFQATWLARSRARAGVIQKEADLRDFRLEQTAVILSGEDKAQRAYFTDSLQREARFQTTYLARAKARAGAIQKEADLRDFRLEQTAVILSGEDKAYKKALTDQEVMRAQFHTTYLARAKARAGVIQKEADLETYRLELLGVLLSGQDKAHKKAMTEAEALQERFQTTYLARAKARAGAIQKEADLEEYRLELLGAILTGVDASSQRYLNNRLRDTAATNDQLAAQDRLLTLDRINNLNSYAAQQRAQDQAARGRAESFATYQRKIDRDTASILTQTWGAAGLTIEAQNQETLQNFVKNANVILPGAFNWNPFWSRNLLKGAAQAGTDAASKWVMSFRDRVRDQMDSIRDLADDIEWSLTHPRKGEQLEARLRRRLRASWKDMRETNRIQNDAQREETIADIRAYRLMIRALLASLDGSDATVNIDTVVSGDATRILTGVGRGSTQQSDKVRAHGGPAYTGETYLVGERGPELLVMGSTSGRVVPNDEIGGGNIVVNVDGERLFQVMNRRMGRSLAMGN